MIFNSLTGGILEKLKLSRLVKNGYSTVGKSMFIKMERGLIKRVSSITLKKMLLGRTIDNLPDSIFEGVIGGVLKRIDDSTQCPAPPMPGEPGFIGHVLPNPPLLDITLPGEGGYDPDTRFM